MTRKAARRVGEPVRLKARTLPDHGVPYALTPKGGVPIAELSKAAGRDRYYRLLSSEYIEGGDHEVGFTVFKLCVEGKFHVGVEFDGKVALFTRRPGRVGNVGACDCGAFERRCPGWLKKSLANTPATWVSKKPGYTRRSAVADD